MNLVFTGEHYNSWPLWYLLSTIYAVQLYMILRNIIKDKYTEKCVAIAILIGVATFFLNDFSKYNSYSNFFEKEFAGIIADSIKNGRLLTGCIYMPIGLFISENKDKYSAKNGTIMFIAFSIITYCTDNSFIRSFATAFSACGLFIVSMNLNLRPLPIWGILRKCSLTVYLIHMYVFTVIYMVLYGEKRSGVIPFMLTTLVSVLIAFMSLIIEKYKENYYKSERGV